jgi:outer membrane protein assembly factor BamA
MSGFWSSLPDHFIEISGMILMNCKSERADHIVCLSRLLPRIFLSLLILLPLSVFAQQANRWQLRRIEFDGLKRQNREQMTDASGLKIGQVVDVEAFNAATQKLLRTGVFKKAGYRYNYSGDEVELIFEVEEAELKNAPCVFDNFIWFSDREIIEAVRRRIPEFDGAAPQSDLITGQIRDALQLLLKSKKISGEVAYEATSNEAGTGPENVFRVKDISLKVCEVQTPGANEKIREKLIAAAKDLIGTEYSRQDTRGYVGAALIPLYHQHGYLKARFSAAQARFGADGPCQNRVIITVPAEEGLLYRWNKAEWVGQQAIQIADLDKAMEMKQGETANAMKIKKGFSSVARVYSKKGYLAVNLKPELTLDDAQQLATYRVMIEEGPQYRMGKITVSGLSENENRKLEGKWKLRAGEIYDGLYLESFGQAIFNELGPQRAATLNPNMGVKPRHDTLTVDVAIELSQPKK